MKSIVLILLISGFSLAMAGQPCSSCHPSMDKGFALGEYATSGNIYNTIALTCPDYAKVLKEKHYTEELIFKSEELLSKLKSKDFYTVPLEKAIPAAVGKYMEINSENILSADDYSKENLKLRFELNKTYSKLSEYDFGFRGRNVFTVTLLGMIFLFAVMITGWKKAHSKKIRKELLNI